MMSRFKAPTSVLTILAVFLFAASSVFAANSVRVVDNLDDQQSRLVLGSSNLSAVEFSVNFDAIGLEEQALPEGTYQELNLPDGEALVAGKIGNVGEPEMPVLTTLIAIPDHAGVTVTANYGSYEIIDNIDVMPMQQPMPEAGWDIPVAFEKNMTAYSQDSFLPGVLAEAGEPAIMRDVRVVQVMIYPVQYNPATRQLKVYHDVSVDISFEGEVINPKTTRANYISEPFLPIYKGYIANWDDYAATLLTSLEVKRGGILIMCPDVTGYDWMADMQQIADWKRKKGYDVVLAGTYEVDPSDGRPSQTQVKSYIQNAYDTWDTPPEFVYLVGDEDRIIPDYPYSSYPSDHPYSMLDGTDYLPDAAVCRVSVDNINELRSWIAKVVLYEIYPDVDNDPEYWLRGIMVAGGNQTVTCPWTVLWAGERLRQRGFVQIDTVFERNYNDPPDYRITNPITAGVGYVNYRGWAGSSGWYDPSYNVSALNQCQNVNKPGIMTSIVCGTGNFGSYTDPCFGETWIRMGTSTAPRGGPSFFGSTDGSTHTRWNNPISFGLYFAFLEMETYHFGMAVIAGKLRQYVNFPREYNEIRKYFHTYNMLGDPELEMRLTIPKVLTVHHPAEIQSGVNSVEIYVLLDDQTPVADAYVTVVMGSGDDEVFFDVTKTDEFGYALLSVPADTAVELDLTVSGRDLRPYLGTINIGQADRTVGLDSYEIDDDMYGGSHGNDDGAVNPTETIELTIDLKNFGGSLTADNVVAVLSPVDGSKAQVHRNQIDYGTIEAGQVVEGPAAFTFTALPDVADDDDLIFRLEVTADGVNDPWTSFVHVSSAAARFNFHNIQVSGDNRLDPGDVAEVVVLIENVGQLDATSVSGTLTSADGFVQVSNTVADFGNIGIDESGNNTFTPFTVTVHEAAFEGRNVPFILSLTYSSGAVCRVPFSVEIGTQTANDPAGPDAYGYYVYDNTDTDYSEHPTYEWTEVRYLGTNKNLYDDTKTMVDLPFDFTYYGDTYDRITICSNGWICMDSTYWVGFRNWRMPDPSYAKTMIAGFWDDLGPSGQNNVYTYYDSENNRYIIEWYNVPTRWSYSVYETFQIILYDPAYHQSITGDGIIEYVYNDVTNGEGGSGENYATVGWEDSTEIIGFSISYSNIMSPGCANLVDQRVYRITTNNGFGGVKGNVTVENSDAAGVTIDISSGQWGMANYDGTYSVRDIPPGTADISFSKDGWFPQTITGVSISANSFTEDINATLDQCQIPGNLIASENLGDHVRVAWMAVGHADLAGYDVYRSDHENGIYAKINDAPVTTAYYDDYTTDGSRIYWYYVVAVYQGADYEAVSLASNKDMGSNDEITDVDDSANLPTAFYMSQNYPNPFNAQTTINFALPADGYITLDVFNVLGQNVRTLYEGHHQAGYVSLIWDGTDKSGDQVASGLYFYRLTTDSDRITKRMLLLK